MKYAKICKMQLFAHRFLIFFCFLAEVALAANSPGKTSCNAKEIELKSCRIEVAPYQLRLTPERVTVSDGTWKVVQELPLVGETVAWQRVNLRQIEGRWLLELEFWTVPEGPAEIQNLKWFVYELSGTTWTKRVDEIVQKRRRQLSATGKNLPTYQLDRKEAYGLASKTAGSISWTAGKLHGTF